MRCWLFPFCESKASITLDFIFYLIFAFLSRIPQILSASCVSGATPEVGIEQEKKETQMGEAESKDST